MPKIIMLERIHQQIAEEIFYTTEDDAQPILTDEDLHTPESRSVDEIIADFSRRFLLEKEASELMNELNVISDEEQQYQFLKENFELLKRLLTNPNLFIIDRTKDPIPEMCVYNPKISPVYLDIFYEKSLYLIFQNFSDFERLDLTKFVHLPKISKTFYKKLYYDFYDKISLTQFVEYLNSSNYFSMDEKDELLALRFQNEPVTSLNYKIVEEYPKYKQLVTLKIKKMFETEGFYTFRKNLLDVLCFSAKNITIENFYQIFYHKIFLYSYRNYDMERLDKIFSEYPLLMDCVDHSILYRLISENYKVINEKKLKSMLMFIKQIDLNELITYVKKDKEFHHYKVFGHIEKEFRENLKCQQEPQTVGSSIFNESFLSLLNQFKKGENLELYDQTFHLFCKDLHEYIEFNEQNKDDLKWIKFYFKRVIKGYPLFKLIFFNNIPELMVEQRFGDTLMDNAAEVRHLISAVSAKHFLNLYHKYKTVFFKFIPSSLQYVVNKNEENYMRFSRLLLIALSVFEYDKLDTVLKGLHGNIRLMEQLFDGIDLSKIKIDSSGKVIYNRKLENLFVNHNYNAIEHCPLNLNIDFHFYDVNLNDTLLVQKYFSYVVNRWDVVEQKIGTRNLSLPRIMQNLYYIVMSNEVYIKYPELSPYVFQIGVSDFIDQALKKYYDIMCVRFYSTIPKVYGKQGNFTYEMLDLDDPLSLIVGKLTNCCFRMDGMAKTSMYHAMISTDGRVFVVKKGEEIVAQSWVWRNGNTVCFDNIEFPSIYRNNEEIQTQIMECYKNASNQILEISKKEDDSIQLITLGIHCVDKSIFQRFNLSSLKNPLQVKNIFTNEFSKLYTDAGDQVILAQTENFTVQNSNTFSKYYMMSRDELITWNASFANASQDHKENALLTVNRIRRLLGKEDIEIENIRKIVYHKDWYFLITQDNEVITDIFSFDPRAHMEYEQYKKVNNKQKVLKK